MKEAHRGEEQARILRTAAVRLFALSGFCAAIPLATGLGYLAASIGADLHPCAAHRNGDLSRSRCSGAAPPAPRSVGNAGGRNRTDRPSCARRDSP